MKGQWIGPYVGTNNNGTAVVELDDMGSHYEGAAFAWPNANLPPVFAPIKTLDRGNEFQIVAHANPIDIRTGLITNWDALKDLYPGVVFSPTLNVGLNFRSDQLAATWTSSFGSGTAILEASRASLPSEFIPKTLIRNWSDFKEYAVTLEPNRYVFRGQESNHWRLRTGFFRKGRFHLMRFMNEDIPALHANLSSLTQHVFELDNPKENGAFYSLVQHHGYPTPLLDWTYSPFIGAFFSYRTLKRENMHDDSFVRIFVFDKREWSRDFPHFGLISPAPPHLSFLNALAINNSRMVPQQALSSVTNIDDLENFIKSRQKTKSKTYLEIIDLPTSARPVVMQELSLMGITAGSMFPGLDGACEQLRERYFEF
jgi:hypothetical protein